jgi:DNA-binding PadR family transcriptional regulator
LRDLVLPGKEVMMAITNKSRYAILGILNISPGTGYDIKKYCDTVISQIWNENFGHIYPTLKWLEKHGFIQKVFQEEKPRKIQYRITGQGKEMLMNWLQEETIHQPVRSEFMLKFLFSNLLPLEKVIGMLSDYKEMQEKKLEKYMKMKKDMDKGIMEISPQRALYMGATLRRGIISYQGNIQWCRETMEIFEKQNEERIK